MDGTHVDLAEKTVSFLQFLEPTFGASLAINLAYLNLEKFRYAKLIAKEARDLLSKTELSDTSISGTDWYRQIQSLSEQTSASPPKLELPLCWWSCGYKIFYWNIDRWFSIFITAYSGIYLVLGVAHSVNLFPGTVKYFTSGEIYNEFWYSTFGLFWPMMMVTIAAFSIRGSHNFIKYQLTGLVGQITKEGQEELKDSVKEIEELRQRPKNKVM